MLRPTAQCLWLCRWTLPLRTDRTASSTELGCTRCDPVGETEYKRLSMQRLWCIVQQQTLHVICQLSPRHASLSSPLSSPIMGLCCSESCIPGSSLSMSSAGPKLCLRRLLSSWKLCSKGSTTPAATVAPHVLQVSAPEVEGSQVTLADEAASSSTAAAAGQWRSSLHVQVCSRTHLSLWSACDHAAWT